MFAGDIDITRIPSQVSEDRKGRHETTVLGYLPVDSATHFVLFQQSVPSWRSSQQYTLLASEKLARRYPGRQETRDSAQHEEPTAEQQISETRIRLIERKHDRLASSEDAARLEILSARLRTLEARENAEATAAITRSIDALEDFSADLKQIKSDFDLDE